MINFNQEYFKNGCYFYLKDGKDRISIYYSVSDNISESRKKDEKKVFTKKSEGNLKKFVKKNLLDKTKKTKKGLKNQLKDLETKGEIEELIDFDGTFNNSKIPIYNRYLSPKKTMDQTVAMSRVSNDPVTRGYRVYWGESEDKEDDVISEIDFSDAFGYEETKNKDYKSSKRILKKMGIEDDTELEERLKQLGKLKKAKIKRDKKDGKLVLKQRLTEKGSIEEEEKRRAIKMLEDILSKKKKNTSDVVNKKSLNSDLMDKSDSQIKKILIKNLKSIKNLADKEGLNINQLLKSLNSDE